VIDEQTKKGKDAIAKAVLALGTMWSFMLLLPWISLTWFPGAKRHCVGRFYRSRGKGRLERRKGQAKRTCSVNLADTERIVCTRSSNACILSQLRLSGACALPVLSAGPFCRPFCPATYTL
jgi:hypothetical protein